MRVEGAALARSYAERAASPRKPFLIEFPRPVCYDQGHAPLAPWSGFAPDTQ
jgi:hypothetical protein